MPKYTATFTEHHQVSVIHSDEFDTSDLKKWKLLKEIVQPHMPDDEFNALPKKPPQDPLIWFSLYQYMPESDYEYKEDDWITARKGGYEMSRELLDSKGKVIANE